LDALAVLLLDEKGRVSARSGSFPDSSFENRWPEAITYEQALKMGLAPRPG
jgi:hypothetical protein